MMPQNKGPAPDYLQENYKTWGQEYAKKREQAQKVNFSWKNKYKNIRQKLSEITKKHCSYCDGFPLGTFARCTIDHFRPKSEFPCLAYVWCNLFLCCDICQVAKHAKFDRRLLKPDVIDYSFEKYFIVNYSTGEIEVNKAAPIHDQERAKLTIEMFGLNSYGRPQSRSREINNFDRSSTKGYELDDFAYRFCFIDYPTAAPHKSAES